MSRPKRPMDPWDAMKQRLYDEGGCCAYCDAVATPRSQWPIDETGCYLPGVMLELDHFIPRCAGGARVVENAVVACSYCNAIKGGRTFASIDEVRAYVGTWRAKREAAGVAP